MLRAQQKKVKSLKKSLGSRWRAKKEYEDLVFVTTMGSLVLRYHAEKEIKKIVKEINMQPKVVQSIMEHQHYSTTIDIYTHVTDAKYREEIEKFGMAMGEEEDILKIDEKLDEEEQEERQGFGMM